MFSLLPGGQKTAHTCRGEVRENILGGRGKGFSMGQHRLAYGRLRHGMHNVAMAQRALDLAAKHVVNRVTFGERLADRASRILTGRQEDDDPVACVRGDCQAA